MISSVNKTKQQEQTTVSGILRVSKFIRETTGAAVSLIGFPAAILTAIAFHGEIWDTFTEPDLKVKVERVTLRCFYRFNDQSQVTAYAAGDTSVFVDICSNAPLAISFKATITNEDRINRTITGFTARSLIPMQPTEKIVDFDIPWTVAHEIHGATETNIRRNWPSLDLTAGRSSIVETWIEPSVPNDQKLTWKPVRDWLTQPNAIAANKKIVTEIFVDVGRYPKSLWTTTCTFSLRPESLETFRNFDKVRQFQFTGACEEM